LAQNAIVTNAPPLDLPTCTFEEPLTKNDWLDVSSGKAVPVFIAIAIYEGSLDYTYVDTTSYRIDLFGGLAYPLGLNNYSHERAAPGRVSRGVTLDIANIKFKEKDIKSAK
jgi:16S rRNA G527 N7-methylase RsmG